MSHLITSDVAESIDISVLCWLATVSEDGTPNVSPKEAFLHDGQGRILVANIASPVTVRNIERDGRVCVSFVNVFVQKGYKVSGQVTNLKPGDSGFDAAHNLLTNAIGTEFPILSIIVIEPTAVAEIVAPSYRLFPDTGPLDRIRESLVTYRVAEYQRRASQQAANWSPRQILVYGDSLSWGVIPSTRQRFEFRKRWPGVMEHELLNVGESVRVVEDCLNGRRTTMEDPFKPGRNGLVGLEQRIEINSPLSLVIVALGTNDFQSMHQFDALQSAQRIGAIISSIRSAPIEPGLEVPEILVLAPPRLQSAKGDIADKFVGAENEAVGLCAAIEDVVRDAGCHFFDAGSVTERSKVDGVHLDEDQHHRLGIALATEVKRIIDLRHRQVTKTPVQESVELRAMTYDDLEDVSRLGIVSKSSWGYADESMRVFAQELTLNHQSLDELLDAQVACEQGRLVGYFTLRDYNGTVELEHLFVTPERFRAGVGTKLLMAALESASLRDAQTLRVIADPNSAGFYEKHGAIHVGDHQSSIAGRLIPVYEFGLPRVPNESQQ